MFACSYIDGEQPVFHHAPVSHQPGRFESSTQGGGNGA